MDDMTNSNFLVVHHINSHIDYDNYKTVAESIPKHALFFVQYCRICS